MRPDVLIKGEDYIGQVGDGQRFVESYGGRVALAPLLAGHSTTSTIARLREDELVANGACCRRHKRP